MMRDDCPTLDLYIRFKINDQILVLITMTCTFFYQAS